MNIKLFLFFVIIALGLILTMTKGPNEPKRKWYVIIVITLLILESCLRSVDVGPDTIHYYTDFIHYSNLSWADVWASFGDAYVKGEGKDPGYLVFKQIALLFTSNFNVFLFFCALPFFVPLGMLLYRFSSSIPQLIFAFTLYVALFHIVALSGIRQQIATGFCFMAVLQLDKEKIWKSLLCIALGATIHVSALIFLVVPILKMASPRLIKSIHFSSFFTIPFVIAFAAPIMALLASFLANDYYSSYAESESKGGAFTYIALMELLSLFCYFSIKKNEIAVSERIKLLYVMLPMLTMTAPLISLNGAMIRLGQYFTLYMMLLVPIAIDSISKNRDRNFIYAGMILALIYLSLRSGEFDYYFFWQQESVL